MNIHVKAEDDVCVLFSWLSVLPLKTGSLMELAAHCFGVVGWPSSPRNYPISVPPSTLGLQVHTTVSGLDVNAWDLVPRAHAASAMDATCSLEM